MVWAATLGLPLSLEGVGAVLRPEKQKLKEGKDLIRFFCTPGKAKDGSIIRHYPQCATGKWETFKAYNLRDVETEMAIQEKLSHYPVPESEWVNYHLDQRINDRGVTASTELWFSRLSAAIQNLSAPTWNRPVPSPVWRTRTVRCNSRRGSPNKAWKRSHSPRPPWRNC